jgi:hypothetical protein
METKIKKTADMTTYIREYKRKTYARDKEMILAQNRAYYAKKNYGIDGVEELAKKYEKKALPIMLRIRKELAKLNAIRPNLVKDVIQLVEDFEAEVAEVEEIKEIPLFEDEIPKLPEYLMANVVAV